MIMVQEEFMIDEYSALLTPRQVQHLLQLSPSTVYRMMREEAIPSIRIGRSRRIPAAAILALMGGHDS
jgi:excisionase family DNA binding protein